MLNFFFQAEDGIRDISVTGVQTCALPISKQAISVIEFGGQLAPSFWLWVVLIGLIIPVTVELYFLIPRLVQYKEFKPHPISKIIVPVAVLIGGFMLRYVIVVAGQITGPVGL